MIISCEKCNKKFELEDNLIPETGRLLQCGSCSYQWHYIPTNKITLVNEIDSTKSSNNTLISTFIYLYPVFFFYNSLNKYFFSKLNN